MKGVADKPSPFLVTFQYTARVFLHLGHKWMGEPGNWPGQGEVVQAVLTPQYAIINSHEELHDLCGDAITM